MASSLNKIFEGLAWPLIRHIYGAYPGASPLFGHFKQNVETKNLNISAKYLNVLVDKYIFVSLEPISIDCIIERPISMPPSIVFTKSLVSISEN